MFWVFTSSQCLFSSLYIRLIEALESISMSFSQTDSLIHQPDHPNGNDGAAAVLFAPQATPSEALWQAGFSG